MMKKVDVLVTYEISVIARAIATDPCVAFEGSKMAECSKRRSPVKIGIVCILPGKIRVVWDGYGVVASEDTIIFHDYDSWIDQGDRFPDPVIITINIDAQNTDTPGKTGSFDD